MKCIKTQRHALTYSKEIEHFTEIASIVASAKIKEFLYTLCDSNIHKNETQ